MMDQAERRRWVLAKSLYLGERSHALIVRSQELIGHARQMRAGDDRPWKHCNVVSYQASGIARPPEQRSD